MHLKVLVWNMKLLFATTKIMLYVFCGSEIRRFTWKYNKILVWFFTISRWPLAMVFFLRNCHDFGSKMENINKVFRNVFSEWICYLRNKVDFPIFVINVFYYHWFFFWVITLIKILHKNSCALCALIHYTPKYFDTILTSCILLIED